MSHQNRIFFCAGRDAESSPKGLSFLQSFAEVSCVTRDTSTNQSAIEGLGELVQDKKQFAGGPKNPMPVAAVVIMLPKSSEEREFRSATSTRLALGRGTYEIVNYAMGEDVPVYLLSKAIDKQSWVFFKVIDCVEKPSVDYTSVDYTKWAYIVVDQTPRGPVELFNYPTCTPIGAKPYTGRHVDWSDPANDQGGLDQPFKGHNPPAPTLSAAVAYYYLTK